MAGLKEVIDHKGVFCAQYSDRGSHFWLMPKVGGGGLPSANPSGTGVARVGVQMTLAYSPGSARP